MFKNKTIIPWLGLAIAKQFIEAQSGSISAHNLPEGRLQVQITFPIN